MAKVKDYEFDTGIIPEIFFDVIARIFPGIIILFVVRLNQIIDPNKLQESLSNIIPSDADVSVFETLAIIFGAYIIGLLIHQLRFIIRPILILLNKINGKFINPTNGEITYEEIYILKRNHPSSASTLLKIQAEITFSEVIIVFFVIMIIFSFFSDFFPDTLKFLTAPTKEFFFLYILVAAIYVLLRNNLEKLSISSKRMLNKESIIGVDISSYWPAGLTFNEIWTNYSANPSNTLNEEQLTKAFNGELLIAGLSITDLQSLINFARSQEPTTNFQNILTVI